MHERVAAAPISADGLPVGLNVVFLRDDDRNDIVCAPQYRTPAVVVDQAADRAATAVKQGPLIAQQALESAPSKRADQFVRLRIDDLVGCSKRDDLPGLNPQHFVPDVVAGEQAQV